MHLALFDELSAELCDASSEALLLDGSDGGAIRVNLGVDLVDIRADQTKAIRLSLVAIPREVNVVEGHGPVRDEERRAVENVRLDTVDEGDEVERTRCWRGHFRGGPSAFRR